MHSEYTVAMYSLTANPVTSSAVYVGSGFFGHRGTPVGYEELFIGVDFHRLHNVWRRWVKVQPIRPAPSDWAFSEALLAGRVSMQGQGRNSCRLFNPSGAAKY